MNTCILVGDASKANPAKGVPPLPEVASDLTDVALMTADDVCRVVRKSQSWLFDAVKRGAFPAPALREPRCTRWRASTVRAHLLARFEQAEADPQSGGATHEKAKKASRAAQEVRRAEAGTV